LKFDRFKALEVVAVTVANNSHFSGNITMLDNRNGVKSTQNISYELRDLLLSTTTHNSLV